MVVRNNKGDTDDEVRYSLLFPDGSLSIIDHDEASIYFSNRRASTGKDGKTIARPEISEATARKKNLSALLFSDGGSTQVYIDEIPEFFRSRWVISAKGMISARNPLKSFNNGVTQNDTTSTAVGNVKIPSSANETSNGQLLISGNSKISEPITHFTGLSNRKLLAEYEKLEFEKAKNKQMVQSSNPKNMNNSGNVDPNSSNLNIATKKDSLQKGCSLDKVISDDSVGLIVPDQGVNLRNNSCTSMNQAVGEGIEQNKGYVKPKGWASLFGSNRNADMGFKVPEIFDGVTKDGVFLKEEHLQKDELQHLRLVGYFAPRFPGPEALAKVVNSWDSPNCKFYQHRSSWTVFTFDNETDLNRVIEGGPYFIFGMTLYVKKMPAFFEFDWAEQTVLPVWVQFPSLPLECWNWPCLGRICTYIGTPQQADEATKAKERLSFARVLVEVDVSKNLPVKVPVHLPQKSIMQTVLYEDIPKFCTKCKRMGHGIDVCTSEKPPEPTLYVSRAARKYQEKVPYKNTRYNLPDSDGWIFQKGKNKRRQNQGRNGTQGIGGNGGNYIADSDLNRNNAKKDRVEKDAVDFRLNQTSLNYNRGNYQKATAGTGKQIPTGKNASMEVYQLGGQGSKQQDRYGDRFDLRSDIEKELELKRIEAYELSCKKNGFDPLNPGKRTAEWSLGDQDLDEFEPQKDTFICEVENNTLLDNNADSDEYEDSGKEEEDEVEVNSEVEIDPSHDGDRTDGHSVKGDKTKKKKNSKNKDVPTSSITSEDKCDKYLVDGKAMDSDIQKEDHRGKGKKKSKKGKKAHQNVNGGKSSGSTP